MQIEGLFIYCLILTFATCKCDSSTESDKTIHNTTSAIQSRHDTINLIIKPWKAQKMAIKPINLKPKPWTEKGPFFSTAGSSTGSKVPTTFSYFSPENSPKKPSVSDFLSGPNGWQSDTKPPFDNKPPIKWVENFPPSIPPTLWPNDSNGNSQLKPSSTLKWRPPMTTAPASWKNLSSMQIKQPKLNLSKWPQMNSPQNQLQWQDITNNPQDSPQNFLSHVHNASCFGDSNSHGSESFKNGQNSKPNLDWPPTTNMLQNFHNGWQSQNSNLGKPNVEIFLSQHDLKNWWRQIQENVEVFFNKTNSNNGEKYPPPGGFNGQGQSGGPSQWPNFNSPQGNSNFWANNQINNQHSTPGRTKNVNDPSKQNSGSTIWESSKPSNLKNPSDMNSFFNSFEKYLDNSNAFNGNNNGEDFVWDGKYSPDVLSSSEEWIDDRKSSNQ